MVLPCKTVFSDPVVHRHHPVIFWRGGAGSDSDKLNPKILNDHLTQILNDQNTGILESFLTKGDPECVCIVPRPLPFFSKLHSYFLCFSGVRS